MPQPDVRSLLVTGPLRDVSVAYRNRNYIADRLFPIIDNVPADAKIAKYLKGAWFRDEAGIRAPGARAVRGGFPVDFVNLAVKEYAFARAVTDEDRRYAAMANAPPLQPDQDAIEFCADRIDLKKERRVASIVLTSTWSTANEDAEGGWAAASGSTTITDIETRIETIRAATGLRPNVLMLSANTFSQVKQDPNILDRIKYTERGIVTPMLLASLFDLDEVLVGDAVYSSANEKADGSDFTAVNVWEANAGKGSAFLAYRPPRPGLKVVMAGAQARCPYEGRQARRVTSWRENAEHQDVYECAENTDIVQVCADAGFLWTDTILT